MTELTASHLRCILDYDPKTGVFRWRHDRGNSIRAGCVAGCKKPCGYIYININRKCCLAARLAWLYVKGVWPSHTIDHKNGNPLDNRFDNLREATTAEQQRNRGRFKNSKVGVKGVMLDTRSGRYVARIGIGQGRKKSLGAFATAEEAASAYSQAATTLYGQFARLDQGT